MSVPMALMDFIPVVLFIAAAIILQRELYNVMSKGTFALFAGGTFMIIVAGTYKAIWKLLFALNICDFEALNRTFFPMQATGFLLAGLGMIALLCHKQGVEKAYSVALLAPVVYSSNMIFVVVLIIGTAALNIGLAVLSGKRKKTIAAVCFILAFIFMMMMGYLSTKDFEKASMNWIAQCVNVVGQGLFLTGALKIRHKC